MTRVRFPLPAQKRKKLWFIQGFSFNQINHRLKPVSAFKDVVLRSIIKAPNPRKEVLLSLARKTLLYQLKHCSYHCSYHIVWTTRYRGKVLADNYIKAELKRMFKQIANWKDLKIYAWHIGDEHIHLHISIPPKYIGYRLLKLERNQS